jgi:hypothetical protein
VFVILTDLQRRGLNFVAVSNAGGYRPTAEEVTEWVDRPGPLPAARGALIEAAVPSLMRSDYGIAKAFDKLTSNFDLFAGRPARYGPSGPPEALVANLIRLRWLQISTVKGLSITPLGRALLREVDVLDPEVAPAIVLESGNPLAYAQLLGHIAESGDAYVIDPYLRMEQLYELMTTTSTGRVLVGSKLGKGDIAGIRSVVTATPDRIQVRQAGAGVLHDRFVIGELGVHQFGTSMNSVGSNTTVLVQMPADASEFLRAKAEEWWADSVVLGPIDPPA